jgi:hypothetical protein
VANGEITKTLIDARALIATPEMWCQRHYFKVKDGKECYCSAGAIYRVMGNLIPDPEGTRGYEEAPYSLRFDIGPANSIIWYVSNLAGFDNLADLNDKHTHQEVLEAFDKAIFKSTLEGI